MLLRLIIQLRQSSRSGKLRKSRKVRPQAMQNVNSYGNATVVVANHIQYLIDLYFYLLTNPPEGDRSGGGPVLGRAKKNWRCGNRGAPSEVMHSE